MQRVREFLRDILRQTDLVLLALCCTATAYGILMIYSATRYMETLRLVLVQTGGAVVGIILFFLLSLVDISELMRKKGWLWLTLFGLGMILLLLVFGEAGDTGNLAWLDFPFLPFMVQPLVTAFEGIGDRPMEVAATLRCHPFDAFINVVMPLARPGIITGILMTFAHTIGEFGVVLMIGGNIPGKTQVVSTEIYTHVEAMEYAQAHVLAGGMLIFSFIVLMSLNLLNKRRGGE